jgi:RNA-directed DNA polymerase
MNQKVLHTQEKIVLAYEKKDLNRVKQLQKNLITSWAGVYVAVQTVTTDEDRHLPGVDGMTWSKKNDKEKAVLLLKRLAKYPEMYKASPVRRVEIPKADGNRKVIEVPTMLDRAYQVLWKLALEPIAECDADERSYGGRPFKGPQDSLTYLWLALVPRKFAEGQLYQWVLDANIKKFYSNVSHDWLLDNFKLINKSVLRKWLKSGTQVTINGKRKILKTNAGISQGGPFSCLLVNCALNGLQGMVKKHTSLIKYRVLSDELKKNGMRKVKQNMSLNAFFVRYKDDFLIICKSKKVINNVILPKVNEFLDLRGLSLSLDKTRIISTKEGINYLGFSIRLEKSPGSRHGVFFKIKPCKESVKAFKAKVKGIVRKYYNQTRLIQVLNGELREWGNFYKGVHSKRTFSSLDYYITGVLIKWSLRKYSGKDSGGKRTIFKKTFKRIGGVKWRFVSMTKEGKVEEILIQLSKIPIKRHFIQRDGLNPFKQEDREIIQRNAVRRARSKVINYRLRDVAKKTNFLCPVCGGILDVGNKAETLHIHHIVPRAQGGSDNTSNLLAIHDYCHMQITYTKNKTLVAKFKKQGVTDSSRRREKPNDALL